MFFIELYILENSLELFISALDISAFSFLKCQKKPDVY